MGMSYALNIIRGITQHSRGISLEMRPQGTGWAKGPEGRLKGIFEGKTETMKE